MAGLWSSWLALTPFWRFQIAGWTAFIVATFPLKWDLCGSFTSALLLCVTRDGISFILTIALRMIYRTFWCTNGITMGAVFVVACSIAGVMQGATIFMFRDFLPPDGEIHLRRPFPLTALYERTGLFFGWSFLYFGIKLHVQGREREVRLARVESEHKAVELRLLRTIMNPHFLFNALNYIKSQLLGSRNDLAHVIQGFTNYLQFALITRDKVFVPVCHEYEAIQGYLKVEEARFGREIEIVSRIEPEVRQALVPGIIIQPLVENAIKHGRSQLDNLPLILNLVVCKKSGKLHLEVRNSGRWLAPREEPGPHGVGLSSLKERLTLIYGKQHSFNIAQEHDAVVVTVTIPFHIYDHAY